MAADVELDGLSTDKTMVQYEYALLDIFIEQLCESEGQMSFKSVRGNSCAFCYDGSDLEG